MLKLSNSLIINPSCPHLSGPPKISHPPYLPNGDRLGKNKCSIGFKTLKNGGVGHLKTPKQKPNFGEDTHVTLNPKPTQLYIFCKTSHISIILAKLGITP